MEVLYTGWDAKPQYPKTQHRTLVEYQWFTLVISCLPSWSCGLLAAAARCAAQLHKSIQLHIASTGEDQNSKSEVQSLLNIYCFHIIVNAKSQKILNQTTVLWRWRPSSLSMRYFLDLQVQLLRKKFLMHVPEMEERIESRRYQF